MRRPYRYIFILTLIILNISTNVFALPSITFIDDSLEIQVESTYLESTNPWAPPPSQPSGTIVEDGYSGSLFDLGAGDTFRYRANTNVASAMSNVELYSGSDTWSMTSWVNVDDDTGLDFPIVDGPTASASSTFDSVFHVEGEGASISYGSWWIGNGESQSVASLFDITLGEFVESGLLLDDHTYRFFGTSEQIRHDGISSGLDLDTGYYLNFFGATVSVPEPSALALLGAGFLSLLGVRMYIK